MRDFGLLSRAKHAVEATDLFVDGGIFEGRVEDIDRLVCARH
jgi:hypothetical protein